MSSCSLMAPVRHLPHAWLTSAAPHVLERRPCETRREVATAGAVGRDGRHAVAVVAAPSGLPVAAVRV